MNLQASIRIPRRAKDGDTGKGISEVKDFYGLSSSETSEPTEWFSYIPNKPADKYLWNYEKIIYTDGTSTDTKKRVIQGKDARSIESVVNAYAYSASDTVSPTSGWMSTIKSLGVKPDGYFLWVRDDITYTDGTSSSTAGYVVKEGTDGYSVTLSKDSHTYTYDKDGNLKGLLSNGATTISVQRGDIFFKCDTTSIGLTPVANNTYRVVAIEVDGVLYSGASRTLVNDELKIWPSAFEGETGSMTFTIRAMSDGVVSKDFKKTISFSKNRDGADGEHGKDGASVEFGFRLSDTNSAPAKPTGALPNASWTYTMPLMTTYYRYLWITKRTKAQGSSTWSVWDPPALHAYLPKDGEPGVGIPGTPGLPGQIPITKEWIEGDTHRNTDEYVDYIYVRGTTAELSYFYKLTAKGTKIAREKPTDGSTPTGYEPISWMKELAVKVFIAEEANIAGLIHKQEKLFSQTGETYAGIPLAIGEHIEYNFANTTSQPTISSSSWTELPSGTIRWVRYKKNTESTWTVKQVGTASNRWQLQFAIEPENETWYSSYSTNRFWMRYKTTDDDDYGKAVKITTAGGVDFIPNILIDGVTGRMEMLSAKIRGTIEALSGKIGGFSLENMGLLSDNKLFYIDALKGAIYLLDENGNVKTSIIPNDLPSTPEAFFAGSGGGNLSLTALQGSYNDGQVKTTGSFTIDVSGGKQFSLLIPEIKGSVNTNYEALAGGMSGSSSTTIYFELMRDGKLHLVLGQATARSGGGLESKVFTIQQRTIQISSSGVYSFRARVETNTFPSNHTASGGASVLNISSAEFIAVVNRSQIGNNGMIIASSTTRYDFMVGDKHIIRRGNYGFRITENGLQKSNNMNASTPTWRNIEQPF